MNTSAVYRESSHICLVSYNFIVTVQKFNGLFSSLYISIPVLFQKLNEEAWSTRSLRFFFSKKISLSLDMKYIKVISCCQVIIETLHKDSLWSLVSVCLNSQLFKNSQKLLSKPNFLIRVNNHLLNRAWEISQNGMKLLEQKRILLYLIF